MNDALAIAATGMQAHQSTLTSVANNVANVNTAGYKRSKTSFQELIVSTQVSGTGLEPATVPVWASPAGVAVAQATKSFEQGELRASNDPMSLAIQGAGFLELALADGRTALWRGGRLTVNNDRLLASADGIPLKQHIQVDQDVKTISVASDGTVSGKTDTGRDVVLGRLDVVQVPQPELLQALGSGLYQAHSAAGEPLVSNPGEAGAGWLRQGFEEASNVRLVDEMVQLMVAQRAYEMSVKTLQAADEFAGMANNLRR